MYLISFGGLASYYLLLRNFGPYGVKFMTVFSTLHYPSFLTGNLQVAYVLFETGTKFQQVYG
jgi:hypothetical protein